MNTLVLLGHAQAGPADRNDFRRALSQKGRHQAVSIADAIMAAAGPFDLALVSAAAGTQETYAILDETTPGYPVATVREDLYETNPHTLLDVLRGITGASRVIVVGHEPVMGSLAFLLAENSRDYPIAFGLSTGTAVVLEVPDSRESLAPSSATITAVVRPEG